MKESNGRGPSPIMGGKSPMWRACAEKECPSNRVDDLQRTSRGEREGEDWVESRCREGNDTLFPRFESVGWQLNVLHESTHPPHYHHLPPICNMGFGGSLTKLLEKVKHPAPRSRRKSQRRDISIIQEKMDLTSPVVRPEPRVITKTGLDGEGNGIGLNGTQKDPAPGAGVDEKSVPSPEEVEEKKVVPPTPTPPSPLSHHEKPNGA